MAVELQVRHITGVFFSQDAPIQSKYKMQEMVLQDDMYHNSVTASLFVTIMIMF